MISNKSNSAVYSNIITNCCVYMKGLPQQATDRDGRLHISQVTVQDSGQYVCSALDAAAGAQPATVTLIVDDSCMYHTYRSLFRLYRHHHHHLLHQLAVASASACLNDPPPNYSNWPSIFWRPFLVVTLLNNGCLLVITVHEVHLYGSFLF